MKRVTTEIIIERDEVFVVRRRPAPLPGWCGACGETEFAAPETAALDARCSTRTIYRLVEAGLIHFFETPEGFLFVCLRSLSQAARGAGAPARKEEV